MTSGRVGRVAGLGSGVVLRPVRDDDRTFLLEVFASTRSRELAALPLEAQGKAAFLRAQFAAQDRSYRQRHPGATFDVVLVDGRPAGRLYLHRRAGEINVLDISLLPEYRGRGVGSALLLSVLAEAEQGRLPVLLQVERSNPAQRLYDRLGFELAVDGEIYRLMRWTPPDADADAGPALT